MSGTLRGVLDAARNSQAEPQPAHEEPGKAAKARASRPTGKSSSEEYERLTVYVRKRTKDEVARRLIGTDQDLSDLVQALLERHLGA